MGEADGSVGGRKRSSAALPHAGRPHAREGQRWSAPLGRSPNWRKGKEKAGGKAERERRWGTVVGVGVGTVDVVIV